MLVFFVDFLSGLFLFCFSFCPFFFHWCSVHMNFMYSIIILYMLACTTKYYSSHLEFDSH